MIVRELAEYQVDRYPAVLRWPIGEALMAYEAKLKADAQNDYAVQLQIAASAGVKAPDMPPILREVI